MGSRYYRKRSGAPKGGTMEPSALRLVRAESAGAKGIVLIYESHGQEHAWLLDHTSAREVMALLMKGRLNKGSRVVVEGEVALEPPEDPEAEPHLCFCAGPLESCMPIDRSSLKDLRRDIDRFLDE